MEDSTHLSLLGQSGPGFSEHEPMALVVPSRRRSVSGPKRPLKKYKPEHDPHYGKRLSSSCLSGIIEIRCLNSVLSALHERWGSQIKNILQQG
jgi:hypothetical protein